MQSHEPYRSLLLRASGDAGALLYKEIEHTKREQAWKLKQPIVDRAERAQIEATDLDKTYPVARQYIDACKTVIRNSKGRDDTFAGLDHVVHECLCDSTFRTQDLDAYKHLARFLELLAERYDALGEASEAGAYSDAIALKLRSLAEYAEIGGRAAGYSSYFVFHINPFDLPQASRPYSLPTLATVSYLRDKNVEPKDYATFAFTRDDTDEINARVNNAFVKIVEPYLPATGAVRRVGPDLFYLIGVAHDAAIARKYEDKTPDRPLGELLTDDKLIADAQRLLQPVFAKYPNLTDNIEQYLQAVTMLEREIKGEKASHAASVIERREGNVLEVKFGGRT